MKVSFLKTILFVIIIYSNTLVAQIQFLPYINIPTGSWPTVVAIGDVNNDGLNDVVLGNRSYASSPNDFKILVFIQNNSGNLNTPIPYSYTNLYQNISSIAITDLNQDGLNDVLIGYHSKIGIFYQNDNATLNPATIIETSQLVISLKCGDLNNDSITDFAVSYDNTDFFNIYFQSQPGTFTAQSFSKPNFMTFKELEIGDVNNDSKNDIIALSSNPSSIYTYLQNSTNSFTNYTTTTIENLYGIGIGDLNNDGKNDIAFSKGGNSPSSKIGILYQNNSAQIYQNPIEIAAYDIPEPVTIADLNNDGKNEIIFAHGGWNRVSVFEQNNNTYSTYSLFNIPYASGYNPQGMDVGDINNDGKKDIVIADYNNGLVILYNNSTLSVKNNIKNNFTIYPNPTINYFQINMQSEMNANYEIFDINGKLIQFDTVQNSSTIDSSKLQKGFYFLTVKTSDGKATYKLIKN